MVEPACPQYEWPEKEASVPKLEGRAEEKRQCQEQGYDDPDLAQNGDAAVLCRPLGVGRNPHCSTLSCADVSVPAGVVDYLYSLSGAPTRNFALAMSLTQCFVMA